MHHPCWDQIHNEHSHSHSGMYACMCMKQRKRIDTSPATHGVIVAVPLAEAQHVRDGVAQVLEVAGASGQGRAAGRALGWRRRGVEGGGGEDGRRLLRPSPASPEGSRRDGGPEGLRGRGRVEEGRGSRGRVCRGGRRRLADAAGHGARGAHEAGIPLALAAPAPRPAARVQVHAARVHPVPVGVEKARLGSAGGRVGVSVGVSVGVRGGGGRGRSDAGQSSRQGGGVPHFSERAVPTSRRYPAGGVGVASLQAYFAGAGVGGGDGQVPRLVRVRKRCGREGGCLPGEGRGREGDRRFPWLVIR